MKKTFIIGGAGQIGRRLAQQLAERGHQPMAMHRSPEQAEALSAFGANPVLGDLLELDAHGLAQLMQGSDVIVFSAGAGGKGGEEMTSAIDGRGLEMAVGAARQAGIRRFLLVSVFPEAGRTRQVSDTFENYLRIKKRADAYLAETDLDWVILRPGRLLDSPGTGKVRAGPAIPYSCVSRDDVATVLAELVGRPDVKRTIIELTKGGIPVDEAVHRLAAG